MGKKENKRYAVIYSSYNTNDNDSYNEIMGTYSSIADAVNAIDEDLSYIGFIIEDATAVKNNRHPHCKGCYQVDDCGNIVLYSIQEIKV